jgi:hypothetical protein
MTGRWMLNLALLLVLLGLVWLIRVDLAATRTPPTLAGIGTPEPHLIEIARDGEPTLLLERLDSGWRMRAPWDLDADPERVAALLEIRHAPLLRSVPEQAAALDELGLEPVRLRLRLDTTDIAVGGTDPITQARYLASDGLVHLIPDHFYHRLITPPLDYVARTLFPRAAALNHATLNGASLSSETLRRIATLSAERLEPMTGMPEGDILELRTTDGDRIPYQISADGRRWTRPDLELRYVLSEATRLERAAPDDPSAMATSIPVAPQTNSPMSVGPETPWPSPDPLTSDWPTGSFGSDSETLEAAPGPDTPDAADVRDPLERLMDPDAPLSGDLPLGPPPEVRLRPHVPAQDDGTDRREDDTGPRRDPPAGFGQDPFAPTREPSESEPMDQPGSSGQEPWMQDPWPQGPVQDRSGLEPDPDAPVSLPPGFGEDPFAPDPNRR